MVPRVRSSEARENLDAVEYQPPSIIFYDGQRDVIPATRDGIRERNRQRQPVSCLVLLLENACIMIITVHAVPKAAARACIEKQLFHLLLLGYHTHMRAPRPSLLRLALFLFCSAHLSIHGRGPSSWPSRNLLLLVLLHVAANLASKGVVILFKSGIM